MSVPGCRRNASRLCTAPGEVHVDTDLVNRFCILFVADPAAGNKTIYAIRLVSYLMILAAIAYKNRR